MNKKQIIQDELNKLSQKLAQEEIRAKSNLLIAREIPEFCKLDNQRRKLILELSKQLPTSKEIASKTKQLNTLISKQNTVLKNNGISPTALQVNHSCKKCNDTGYVDGQMCTCLKSNVQHALIKQSGINSKLQYDFSKCDKKILDANEYLSKIYRFAHKYCDNFPNNPEPNLVFFGEVGTGKTFLLECIANELLSKLFYVVFTTAYDVCATMVKAFNSPYAERETILSPLFESDLLIVDDLGTEPLFHETTLTNLFTLINERQRNNKPLIVSTNLNPEQIDERYGNRIKSRLYNKRTTIAIKFEGVDLRLKK